MLVLVLWFWLFSPFFAARSRTSRGRPFVPSSPPALRARKPEWVGAEIVRLKAHLADYGCRKIADTFNRLHHAQRGMTVSKSWVATLVRERRRLIEEQRREWKGRIPRPMPANLVWGLDLTGKGDVQGSVHPILGIVDHGSRLAVRLEALSTKTTIAILRTLLDAIERHGKLRAVRTDNESSFTSFFFRLTLAVLRIRHQRTELHCPWQNGRVERFFWTLKEKLDRWAVDDLEQLGLALGDFRTWYNHVRPHQHLGGRTPAEAWAGIDPYATPPKEVRYFSAWEGTLTGYWMRR